MRNRNCVEAITVMKLWQCKNAVNVAIFSRYQAITFHCSKPELFIKGGTITRV